LGARETTLLICHIVLSSVISNSERTLYILQHQALAHR
jgi:hypothetical protein